jgi:hypothetical protein
MIAQTNKQTNNQNNKFFTLAPKAERLFLGVRYQILLVLKPSRGFSPKRKRGINPRARERADEERRRPLTAPPLGAGPAAAAAIPAALAPLQIVRISQRRHRHSSS